MSEEEYREVIEVADRSRRAARQQSRRADLSDNPILRVAGSLSGAPMISEDIDASIYDFDPER